MTTTSPIKAQLSILELCSDSPSLSKLSRGLNPSQSSDRASSPVNQTTTPHSGRAVLAAHQSLTLLIGPMNQLADRSPSSGSSNSQREVMMRAINLSGIRQTRQLTDK